MIERKQWISKGYSYIYLAHVKVICYTGYLLVEWYFLTQFVRAANFRGMSRVNEREEGRNRLDIFPFRD